MSERSGLPRAVVVAQRLQVLEIEAAMQRTTLAATLAQWHQPRALGWVTDAAKVAGSMLATPTARWVLTALLMRVIRGRA
jgi:hypothetical protein